MHPGARAYKLMVYAASLLLGLGIFAPCMTVVPRFGEFSFLVAALRPEYGARQVYSIAGGIRALLTGGHCLVGGVILVFSVIFPLWKLGVLLHAAREAEGGGAAGASLRLIEILGRYSMLDVLVLALLVLAIKGLPGGSQVELNWG